MTKYLCALLALCFFSYQSKAQNQGGGVDNEIVHFGFTFQYVSSEYKIYKKEDWRDPFFDPQNGAPVTEPLYSISSNPSPGFGLGFVSDLKLGTNADLRFTPLLVFPSRFINYEYEDSKQNQKKEVQATLVDLPLGFKLKSDRRGNFRAYILAGGKFSTDIISKKKTTNEGKSELAKLVGNTKNYFSYEAGIGFDLYFEYFKLSPEIKFSQSINSVLKPDKQTNAYTQPLDKLFLRNFQFSLYFE
jgi:hypothetical protein